MDIAAYVLIALIVLVIVFAKTFNNLRFTLRNDDN